ncbi:helix-turn-helix domain-containing protein [Lachnospiraceae bacterium HCP28S3_F9]|uniref:helix-turn-helix domain-containing protein n=1 Tax=Lachnospiraceae TaxID=186803 RepID=UPI003040CECC|nr:helix-turn-helix domain-containing protein [Lachnospiraceae bacterium]MCI6533381.1 helix-turn-helix domain-containing protein [Lachnospiraceae bacterium]
MNTTTLNRERLIECRKKLGITKQQAAIRMQLSQPAYLRYESGERTPSIHVIYYMAHVLGTSADYLTGKTDDPNPSSYLINADNEPELFSLIEIYRTSDSNTKERISSYFHKLSEPNQN